MIRKMYCIETDKNSLYVDKDVYDYIVSLEQQCIKQKEVIDKDIEYIKEAQLGEFANGVIYWLKDDEIGKEILQILEDKEVSEWMIKEKNT